MVPRPARSVVFDPPARRSGWTDVSGARGPCLLERAVAMSAQQLRVESLSLTPKQSPNWARRARGSHPRKKDLRLSDSSDDDIFPGTQRRGKAADETANAGTQDATASSLQGHGAGAGAHDKVAGDVLNKIVDADGKKQEQSPEIGLKKAAEGTNEHEALIAAASASLAVDPPGKVDDFRRVASVEPVESPWEAPIVIHTKRCLRPVTPESSPKLMAADPPAEVDDFGRVASVEPVESPWGAPIVIHTKRCLRPVTPESSPQNGPAVPSEDCDFGRVASFETAESPWEAPIVIHDKRCVRPLTPEPCNMSSDDEGLAPEIFALMGEKQSVTPEPSGDTGDFESGEKSKSRYADTQQEIISAGKDLDNSSNASENSTADATNLIGRSKKHRSIPAYRTRVTREVLQLLEDPDVEDKPIPRSLDARGINPRVERAMNTSDSDDELYNRDSVLNRRAKAASRAGRAAASASASTKKIECGFDDVTASLVRSEPKSVANAIQSHRSAVWSDDDDEDVVVKTLSASEVKQSISTDQEKARQDEEKERAMEAFRTTRRLFVMERKAMHIAQGSDSDDDEPSRSRSKLLQPHVMQREIDKRLRGKGTWSRSNILPSVPPGTLEASEQECVVLEDEEIPSPPREPPPTTFLTPLRSKRPIPGRR